MKRKISTSIFLTLLVLILCSCSNRNSTFNIQFINVGQGDSALVECDGHYMLIDAGDKAHGEKVLDVLQSNDISRLDILALSHLHNDHYGGLITVLPSISKIDLTISNEKFPTSDDEPSKSNEFEQIDTELNKIGTAIKVPSPGDTYSLGSAKIEVIDSTAIANNDSLVLLITYGKTRFLFTGDIEEEALIRVYQKYRKNYNDKFKIDVLKLPHHGACSDDACYNNALYASLDTFLPDYVIISVGSGNKHGHPRPQTINLLENSARKWEEGKTYFRTDLNGTITVKSDGNKVDVFPQYRQN